ncbi:MAG: AAA family ATPase [Granulosicoccus sp.]
MEALPYVKEMTLRRSEIERLDVYPFSIPAVRELVHLEFGKEVTFFVGENGSGKSTLLEAIAVGLGFNPEGGTRNFNFVTRGSHSNLYKYLTLSKSYLRPKDGFFLRAESYFNVATNIEHMDAEHAPSPPVINSYGGVSLHEQSHGESFLSLVLHRFGGKGIYLLDEPEAALSPTRQLAVLSRMRQLIKDKSQFIIATHSPILLAYPGASIYLIDGSGISPVKYEDTEHYEVTKAFLENPQRMLDELFLEN